jgi:uncharacterized protein (TIGR02246 family)
VNTDTDERAIRELIDTWMRASRAGDTATVLSLMTDDVVFMVPGREPFGKEAFASSSESMKNVTIDGHASIVELQVLGDWAYLRNHLDLTMTPAGGTPVHRTGYTLTLLRKEGGRWRLCRDANLVS